MTPTTTQKTFGALAVLAVVAVVGATLSTAALAERGGPDGAMGTDGPMSGPPLDFAAMDADGDGKVTRAEVDAFRQARVTGMDANGDGLLSAEEIQAAHIARVTERSAEVAARMIAARDANADGLLSVAEMAAPPVPVDLFDRIDTDADGAISQVEADAARERMAHRMRRHGGHHGGPGPDAD